jgi:hypothetical protein
MTNLTDPAEIASISLITPLEIPKDTHNEDIKRKHRRLKLQALKEERKLSDNGTFIINTVKDSLLSTMNAHYHQMNVLKGQGKTSLHENLSMMPYEQEIKPYQSEETEMVLTGEGDTASSEIPVKLAA